MNPSLWLIGGLGAVAVVMTAASVIIRRRYTQGEARAREAVRERLLVLQSISDRVTYLDHDFNLVWTNRVEQSAKPVSCCHELIMRRDTPCANCPAKTVLQTGREAEGVVETDDGRVERMSAAPVRDDDGVLIGVVLTARDITEKRELAEYLQQAQKMEAVGQLAAGVAHDFNNSLQVILGYGQVMSETMDRGDAMFPQLQAIIRSGKQARNVVRQLLTFSRKRESHTEAVDLGGLARDQVEVLSRLVGASVAINLSVASDLPVVSADRTQVEQVLMNLCANARDAMPQGGRLDIVVERRVLDAEAARRCHAPQAGEFVELSVADEGEGIPLELQSRIYDPFFTTKSVDQGTGMGLATVFGIVSAHGGYIDMDSKPGHGAAFRIGWPARTRCADSR